MGKAVSAFRETLMEDQTGKNKDVIEQLTFLVKCANTKLDKYEGDLNEMFMNRESTEKKAVPGLRALRWERGYHVGHEVTASGADGSLGDVIDTFFGAGETDEEEEEGQDKPKEDKDKPKDDKDKPKKAKKLSPVLEGFKKLVSTGLNAILTNTNVGEHEEQKFFVFMKHNAPIRVDVKIWRYNFASKGVMAQSDNVMCYTFCTSIVEHQALSVDELTYLFSEYAGDNDVEIYVDKLISIWTKIHSIAALTGAKGYPIPYQDSAQVVSAPQSVPAPRSVPKALPAPSASAPVQTISGGNAGGSSGQAAQKDAPAQAQVPVQGQAASASPLPKADPKATGAA